MDDNTLIISDMNFKHPYRSAYIPEQKKRKFCLLFHNWNPSITKEKEEQIEFITDEFENKNDQTGIVFFVDPFVDYNLICMDCGKMKPMSNNIIYVLIAMEDFKKRICPK